MPTVAGSLGRCSARAASSRGRVRAWGMEAWMAVLRVFQTQPLLSRTRALAKSRFSAAGFASLGFRPPGGSLAADTSHLQWHTDGSGPLPNRAAPPTADAAAPGSTHVWAGLWPWLRGPGRRSGRPHHRLSPHGIAGPPGQSHRESLDPCCARSGCTRSAQAAPARHQRASRQPSRPTTARPRGLRRGPTRAALVLRCHHGFTSQPPGQAHPACGCPRWGRPARRRAPQGAPLSGTPGQSLRSPCGPGMRGRGEVERGFPQARCAVG